MTEPVRRGERLADRVTAQLETLVIGDSLQPGDLLPPERELCELLGVSRTVVRRSRSECSAAKRDCDPTKRFGAG